MSGDSCFLNQFRGLDFRDATEAGIDPNSFLEDTTAGNVFHAVLLVVGLALNFASHRLVSETLFVVGLTIAGPGCFILLSELMKQMPELYHCFALVGGSLLGGVVFGIYVAKVLGEEGVFKIIGFATGLLGGLFLYMLIFIHLPPTGVEFMGRDLNQALVIVGCGIVGYVVLGKVA